MKNYCQIFVVISLLGCFGCQREENHQSQKFTCKDYKLNVPIESVDVETNGKKGGDTHFYSASSDAEVFYSYALSESAEKAIEAINRIEKDALRLLRKNELKVSNGSKSGEKVVILNGEDYKLVWTKGAMINSVSSKSLSAVEEIEKNCNL